MTYPLTTLINSLLFFISWQRITDKLTQRRTNPKRLAVYLLVSISLQFVMATAIKTVPVLIALFHHTMLWAPMAFTIQGILMWALLYRSQSLPRAVSSIALSYFFFYGLMILFDVLIIEPVYFRILDTLSNENQRNLLFNFNVIIVHLGALAGSFLIGGIIDKVRFPKYFAGFFTSKVRSAAICGVSLLLMHSLQIITWIFPNLENESWYYFAFSFLDLISLFLILFVAVFETNREKVKAQETFITQQQIYVQSLESLQQDLRSFRHDYQNLLSSLYLSASEGDSETLQETLKQTMGYFDRRLGNQILQVTELSRVEIPEVKSLLLVKLMQADKAGVPAKLEIPSPVNRVDMGTEDFLRCLGILVDNAIEAAAETGEAVKSARTPAEKPYPPLAETDPQPVRIALIQSEAELFVSVSNPTAGKPSVAEMEIEGFSTKGDKQGDKRGTGLAGYRKIKQRYSNILSCTAFEDGIFRQTLQIRRTS